MRNPLLMRAAEHAADYLSTIDDRPVHATADGDHLRARLAHALDNMGVDPFEVIDNLAASGRDGTVATQGPRYFGFVVGGSIPAATAADWLVSAWDQNAGIYALSPLASVVEDIVAGWMRDFIGVTETWSVGFVTGGQMANFTCLAAARHHVLRAAGWDVERDGLFGAPPVDVIVSDESHYTIFTALRMLGFGAGRLRRIETDGQGSMRVDRLEEALKDSSDPCIICAQAGNVNTGAFDPLASIAALARARGAWLHVDAAFGLWAVASPSLRHLVDGAERADSIATDAHKWLNVPYDCGIAMTAHRESHRRALMLPAHYIQETASERDPHEFTPEESRRARAVPVYAALRVLGRAGLRHLVERCCAHARRMAATLAAHPQVRVLNEVVLNQVLVQCVSATGDASQADALTRQVIAAVQNDGTCWLGGTTWQGKAAMRISVSNWSTTEADIDRSASAILRLIPSGPTEGGRDA
ncbi:MAG: aspartate aminotransferase family protein [Acidobacteria bacterium]|nr:aspartate aminotransferase family protein [Acidobacteriota bacterium]